MIHIFICGGTDIYVIVIILIEEQQTKISILCGRNVERVFYNITPNKKIPNNLYLLSILRFIIFKLVYEPETIYFIK